MKLVCIGDSLTYGYGVRRSGVWTSLVQEKLGQEVLNKGISGDTTGGMLARFYRDVLDNRPTHVIIMGGANDLIMEVPISVIKANVSAMVHQAYCNRIIPIIGLQMQIDPAMANEHWPGVTDFYRVNEELFILRDKLIGLCQAYTVKYIDFNMNCLKHIQIHGNSNLYLDGLHLNAEGNILMANAVII